MELKSQHFESMIKVFFDRVKKSRRSKWDAINDQSDGSLFKLTSRSKKESVDLSSRGGLINIQQSGHLASLDGSNFDPSILEYNQQSAVGIKNRLESLINTCMANPKFCDDSLKQEHNSELNIIEEKEARMKKAIESY